MAFVSTVTDQSVHGNHRVKWGTYTNTDTDSGGDIDTGFSTVFGFSTVSTGHVGVTNPKYTASAGTITLVTDNGDDGNWFAIGL